ncbi:hypothetical protein PILCRDRAFT_828878, partial [Piloderma croceum F 1598]
CSVWFQVDKWVAMFSIVVVDALMLLCTWALWGMSRAILISLSILLVVCIIVATWSILYTVSPIPSLNIRPCGNNDSRTDVFYGLWISFIVYDSTVMILTLIKAVPSLQPNISTPLITASSTSS